MKNQHGIARNYRAVLMYLMAENICHEPISLAYVARSVLHLTPPVYRNFQFHDIKSPL
jgi:hypothetical protein